MPDLPKKLYQQIAAEIAADIQKGVYTPGERMPAERDLALKYNVSRPTMREVLIALEVVNLVNTRKGSGTYVVEDVPMELPSTDLNTSAFELIEARILIEGEAAALAAQAISDEELEELKGHLDDMEREIASAVDRGPADRNFHFTIARAANNSLILETIRHYWSLGDSSQIYKYLQRVSKEAGYTVRFDEHKAVYDALARRDATAARKAMRQHLTRVMTNILDATESEAITRARREIQQTRDKLANRLRS